MKSAFKRVIIIPTELLYDAEVKYKTIGGNWLEGRDFLNRPFDVAVTVDPIIPIDFYFEDDLSNVKIEYNTPDFRGRTECLCNTRSSVTPFFFKREVLYEV